MKPYQKVANWFASIFLYGFLKCEAVATGMPVVVTWNNPGREAKLTVPPYGPDVWEEHG